jgi:MFS transporter, SP family, general alpha glucoside:H+ symporter
MGSHIELFKGTDLRRTLIVCGVYAAQNLTGNLIANQAVYFFKQAGVSTDLAFALGLITSALQWIFVMLSGRPHHATIRQNKPVPPHT